MLAACAAPRTEAPPLPATPAASDTPARVPPDAGPAPSAASSTASASASPAPKETKAMPTFDEEVAYLGKHGAVVVLTSPAGGRVAVSPTYQGRVMTSAVAASAPSLGFVNHAFIDKGVANTAFDNYGGEDRFWLGPEGGQFALYFPKDAPFAFDKWQTPAAFQTGAWPIKEQSATAITFERDMTLTNYAGTAFTLKVTRTVRLLSADDVRTRARATAGNALPDGVSWVAFETENRITNTGKTAWSRDKGLLSIWVLGMYNPSPDTSVVVPFERAAKGEIVNDRYFGKVPAERLAVKDADGVLVFSCDGNYRSKIGLGPARAKSLLGSYSPSARLLTLVNFDKPAGAKDYVNSMWETQKEPFGGDVVNSYNDGPTEPGKPSLGGFYELETSSPAAALAPGASLVHTHRTMHLVGDAGSLEGIGKSALGTSLGSVRMK